MAVNEWDFMEQCHLDTVQLVVCQRKIYFPQQKKNPSIKSNWRYGSP